MKRIAPWRAAALAVSVVIPLAAATVGAAHAADDLDKYRGDRKNATVDTKRTHDQTTDQTTFTFTLKTNGENVGHVVLMACPDVNIVNATGPAGANKESAEPKADPSIKDSPHVGIEFEPGAPGPYTIVFAGNIAGAEFVVKDGDGHKHFTAGSDVCKPVSAQTGAVRSGAQVAGENLVNAANPQENLVSAANPQQNPGTAANPQENLVDAANPQQNLVDAANPGGVKVLGEQLTAPDAALARTGTALPVLAPLGALLLALGSLATGIARRRGRG